MSKVLIADDDANLRETLGEVLKASGYEPVLAQSGDLALTRYHELVAAGTPPVALVIDLLLPKVAGFDLVKKLNEGGCEAPIVLISGVFKGAGHQEEGQKLGAKAFLAKPFDNAELASTLDRLVGPAAAAGPVTVEQQPLPEEGTLLENPVLHLLWRAEREQHSGVLEVFTPKGRGRVFVYRGQVTMAQHWARELNLGFQLVRAGHLTPDMYQEAVDDACERGQGIYDVIKSKAWVRDGEIKEAYRKIIPAIIGRLIAASGSFRWIATEEFAKVIPAGTTKLFGALLAGVLTASTQDLAPHIEPRYPLRLAPGENWDVMVSHLEQACGSSSLERAINGRATLAQLVDAGRNDADRAMRMRQIYLLMSTQAVQASLEVMKVAAREEPAPAAPPPPEPVAAPQAPAPAASHGAVEIDESLDAGIQFNAEELDARERIRMKWELVEGMDHWEVLGVPRGASPAEVKKAYFSMAREYHTDSFAGMRLGSMQPVLDRLFSLIAGSYETLTNEKKRGEYEAKTSMEESGMSTDIGALFDAERDFDKGHLLLERGELVSAAKFFDKALAQNPTNRRWEAHAIYAGWWARRDPQDAAARIAKLESFFKEKDDFFDALYFAGRLAMEANHLDKARRHFKKVLSEEPGHVMAQRDSRTLNKRMEEAAAKEKAGAGLMGRFLKR